MNEQEKFNNAVIEALDNQSAINTSTREALKKTTDALKKQENLNDINQRTIHSHGETIKHLLISNIALIIGFVLITAALAFK